MADRGLPADADDWAHAWELLLRRPWVRARANKRYVTLHDALAEELGKRVIPLHDQDGAWRNELWHRAKNIYAQLTERAGRTGRRRTHPGRHRAGVGRRRGRGPGG